MTQENHQDYICMTMITAGAAMLAAVFFIFNLGHPDNSTGSAWIRLLASGMAMGAMLSYGALVLSQTCFRW